jgi:hypothetical protein
VRASLYTPRVCKRSDIISIIVILRVLRVLRA